MVSVELQRESHHGSQGEAGAGAEILGEAGDHEQWVLVLTTQGRHSA